MKKWILMIGVIALAIVAIAIVVFVRGDSSEIELKTESVNHEKCGISEVSLRDSLNAPEVGAAYANALEEGMVVIRVIEGEGVIARTPQKDKEIFVETGRTYVDGTSLAFGLYVCVGTAKISRQNGVYSTMWAFEEMENCLAQDRIADFVRQKAEEVLKRKKLEAEQKFEQEKAALKAAEQAAEAAEELKRQEAAQRAELEKIKAETKRREDERRMAAELQAKREREAREAEEAEEAKKRYPIEQKQRQEYAAAKLSDLDFKLSKYIRVQKDMKRYIYSSDVTEINWKQLKTMQGNKDWLGMLGVLLDEEQKDYPKVERIDRAIAELKAKEFHVEFKFTHDFTVSWGAIGDVGEHGYDDIGPVRLEIDSFCGQDATAIIRFSMKENLIQILYSGYESFGSGLEHNRNKYRIRLNSLQQDLTLGKVTEAEVDRKRQDLIREYVQAVYAWLDSAKVNDVRKKRVRGKMSPSEAVVSTDPNEGADFSSAEVDSTVTTRRKALVVPKKRVINPDLKKFK